LGSIKRQIILLLATGGGVGYSPWCPGTIGTLLSIPLSFGVNRIAARSLLLGLLILLCFIGGAVWVSGRSEPFFGRKDPGNIVVDEIVGFLVANFLAPSTFFALALAFVIFRIFDIVKVFPASRLETLGGGLGIVSDDVIAGVYTFIILRGFSALGLI